MPRAPRIDVGGEVYHVINRANGKQKIFNTERDFKHFESLLLEARDKFEMRILAYVEMSNHWHLVLYPKKDGDIQKFMHWLTLTHTQQYRTKSKSVGFGHLYQGRYKSFVVEKDNYLTTLIRYVEQNPLRAKMVTRAEDWKWSSAWRRYHGSAKEKLLLSPLPTELPHNYKTSLNDIDMGESLRVIRASVNKGKPYGKIEWVERMVKKFDLVSTTRPRGRPRNS